LAAVQGSTGDVAVLDQKAGAGAAVGDQVIQRGGAGAQGRRAGEHLLLEGALVVVKQGLEDAGPGAEVAEDSALAQARLFRQRVHGEAVLALLGEHPAGRVQEVAPVADRVGAPGGRRSLRRLADSQVDPTETRIGV
jgi:hypothetical protein